MAERVVSPCAVEAGVVRAGHARIVQGGHVQDGGDGADADLSSVDDVPFPLQGVADLAFRFQRTAAAAADLLGADLERYGRGRTGHVPRVDRSVRRALDAGPGRRVDGAARKVADTAGELDVW